MNKAKIQEIFERLDDLFKDPQAPLMHKDAFTLLVAVILSAQCTDARVNMVTPNLFGAGVGGFEHGYDTPEKMLQLGEEGLKKIIKSCGFYNAKARNIISMCMSLVENFNGKVPGTLDELTSLAGVGRKTASVVLTQWFEVPAVPVDTHIQRISNRLGICTTKTPEKTEQAWRKKVPEKYWIDGHIQMIFHGRKTCTARKPLCSECPLFDLCEWKSKFDFS